MKYFSRLATIMMLRPQCSLRAMAFLIVGLFMPWTGAQVPSQTAGSEPTTSPLPIVTARPEPRSWKTAVLAERKLVAQDYCGSYDREKNGGDAQSPMRCSSQQSFCELFHNTAVRCCPPEYNNIGSAACEFFTTCYGKSDLQTMPTTDPRALTWYSFLLMLTYRIINVERANYV
jgi:hypothetical protein